MTTDAERAVREAHERVEEVRRAIHLNYRKWPLFDKMIDEANATIDRAIEAVRDETFRNTYADANEEGCKRGRRDENEACAKLCDHPTNMLRDIEPCTAMNHEEDCHGKDATAIRARIGKEAKDGR